MFAAGGWPGPTPRIYETDRTGRITYCYRDMRPFAALFTPDSRNLVTIHRDGLLVVWEIKPTDNDNARQLASVSGFGDCHALAISHAGSGLPLPMAAARFGLARFPQWNSRGERSTGGLSMNVSALAVCRRLLAAALIGIWVAWPAYAEDQVPRKTASCGSSPSARTRTTARLFVGGTACLWAEQGHHVKLVSVTNGDIGHWQMAGGPLAERRRKEVEAAAKNLGNPWPSAGHP